MYKNFVPGICRLVVGVFIRAVFLSGLDPLLVESLGWFSIAFLVLVNYRGKLVLISRSSPHSQIIGWNSDIEEISAHSQIIEESPPDNTRYSWQAGGRGVSLITSSAHLVQFGTTVCPQLPVRPKISTGTSSLQWRMWCQFDHSSHTWSSLELQCVLSPSWA